jgi:hypothetical protein
LTSASAITGSIEVSIEMKDLFSSYLKAHEIGVVTAPFEADGQLVYLEALLGPEEIVGIIADDGDLIVMGARVLFMNFTWFSHEMTADVYERRMLVNPTPVLLTEGKLLQLLHSATENMDSTSRIVESSAGCGFTPY